MNAGEAAPYLCEACLSEQRLTLDELILLTSVGPLRCREPGCYGRAYLAADKKTRKFMERRDRSKPLLGRR